MNKLHTVSVVAAISLASGLALACPGKGGGKMNADANADGKVTLQEAQTAARARFDKADGNKNGVLTKDELPGRAQRMARADANNDGQVTLAEAQAKAQARFVEHDTNKDGVLSGDELARGKRRPREKHEGHGSKA
ncbi:MAG TPA: hypothetical protein VER33_08150 [Polyangiaceae bacterium]|nr:hypothetical protein [Polyangiaceae bacterium]